MQVELAHETVPLATLCPQPLTNDCEEQEIPVKLGDEQIVIKKRYFVHLGTASEKILYAPSSKKVVPKNTPSVEVMRCGNKWMIEHAWDSAKSNPLMAARTWLKSRARVDALDVFKADLRRTQSGHETLQVLARIPHSLISKAKSFSGSHGVLCCAIRSEEVQKQIRTVWLPTDTDLTAAQRQCKQMENLGLFANERGFGVRVKAEKIEVALTRLLGSDGSKADPVFCPRRATHMDSQVNAGSRQDIVPARRWPCDNPTQPSNPAKDDLASTLQSLTAAIANMHKDFKDLRSEVASFQTELVSMNEGEDDLIDENFKETRAAKRSALSAKVRARKRLSLC